MFALISLTSMNSGEYTSEEESKIVQNEAKPEAATEAKESETKSISASTSNTIPVSGKLYTLKGVVNFEGVAPQNKTLWL